MPEIRANGGGLKDRNFAANPGIGLGGDRPAPDNTLNGYASREYGTFFITSALRCGRIWGWGFPAAWHGPKSIGATPYGAGPPNKSPGITAGAPALQLNTYATHLHRRNLMGRYQHLVVAVFGRRGQVVELRPRKPRLGHADKYRPMLRRGRHASELQAFVNVFAIVVGFIRTHDTTRILTHMGRGDEVHLVFSRTSTAVPLVPNARARLHSCLGCLAASSRSIQRAIRREH
jgi:hypothetical protein